MKVIAKILIPILFFGFLSAGNSDVMISEIHYDTYKDEALTSVYFQGNATYGQNCGSQHCGEFMELYNKGDQPINLKGWALYDVFAGQKEVLTTHDFYIEPHGFVILHKNTCDISELANMFPAIGLNQNKTLAYCQIIFYNDGEILLLQDNNGDDIDYIAYGGEKYNDDIWNITAQNWQNPQLKNSLQKTDLCGLLGYKKTSPSQFETLEATPFSFPNNVQNELNTLQSFLSNKTPSFADKNYVVNMTPYLALKDLNFCDFLSEHGSFKDLDATLTYFDGIGRPFQSHKLKQSPNQQDIVQFFEYDKSNRLEKTYLPYESPENSGVLTSLRMTQQKAFYDQMYSTADANNAFVQSVYESSPLSRVTETIPPGEEWTDVTGRTQKTDFSLNGSATGFTARMYSADVTATSSVLVDDGMYPDNTLTVTISKDENWVAADLKNGTVETYIDKSGNIILSRTYNDGVAFSTYSVYDDYGNLCFVLPPEADPDAGSISATTITDFCFQYIYNLKNLLVEKKIPGKDWEYFVYDNKNRLLLSQDGNSRILQNWNFTRYDVFDRPIFSGIHNSSLTRVAMSALVASETVYDDHRVTNTTIIGGEPLSYSNNVYPSTNIELMTVFFYDDFNFVDIHKPVIPQYILGQNVYQNNKSLLTSQWNRVIGTYFFNKNYMFYDYKARVVQSVVSNYLGGYDIINTEYDFGGKILKTDAYHKKLSTDTETKISNTINYSDGNRVLNTSNTINTQIPKVINNFQYDGIGRVIEKDLGGTYGSALQSVDYEFNIRNWLTKINDLDLTAGGDLHNDLFGMEVFREDDVIAGNDLYNGNISAVKWKTAGLNLEQNYAYQYDDLSRLKSANYNDGNANAGRYTVNNISYDKNGNIKTLARNGLVSAGVFGAIDNFTYTYNGNQLIKVADPVATTADNPWDFKDNVDLVIEYQYDANGNLKSDANKGITSISYNYLNLPTELIKANGDRVYWVYDASGQLLKRTANDASYTQIENKEYFGAIEYLSGAIEAIYHAEGRAVPDGSNVFHYEYALSDYLGNNRVFFKDDGTGNPETIQEAHFYPYGMRMIGLIPTQIGAENKKLFNEGSEFEDVSGLQWYNTLFRKLDPQLGRWNSVDPLASKYMQWSPYSSMANNPIIFLDVDGREPVPSYQRLNPWFTLKATQWYSTAGLYDSKTFNAAASYSTKHLRSDAFQSVYQRNAYYGWAQKQADAKGYNSKWFGAAQLVTGFRGVGGTEIPDGGMFSNSAVDEFLQGGNKFLFSHNMKNAQDLLADGQISGSFIDAKGVKQSFEGLTGIDLDNKLVEFEQSKVQEYINSYKGDDLNSIITGINELMSGELGPGDVKDVMKEFFNGGGSFNFKSYEDRVKLGQELIKKAY